VMRMYMQDPTIPTRSNGCSAWPYTRMPRATKGSKEGRSSRTRETLLLPAATLRNLRVLVTVGSHRWSPHREAGAESFGGGEVEHRKQQEHGQRDDGVDQPADRAAEQVGEEPGQGTQPALRNVVGFAA
jgi:hypothetical protein